MKRSRSGTRSRPAKRRGKQVFALALALLAVAAFVASFVLGLAGGRARAPAPAPAAATTKPPISVPDSRVRVQVLNGSRKPGMARMATDRLRDAGFDVVSLGNARKNADRSVVLDRIGQREPAERVAQTLGIERVQTQIDTALYLEVTVILGADWRGPILR